VHGCGWPLGKAVIAEKPEGQQFGQAKVSLFAQTVWARFI
jgi:hypothetical protein